MTINSTSNISTNLVGYNTPHSDPNKIIKSGIWLYFLLVIFEGALRKWFLPGLATPLLIVRDPIALWLVLAAWRKDLLPFNPYLIAMVIIGIIGTFTAVALGHGNILVALYGARMLLFHFPLVFVIANTFTRKDIIQMGKITILIAIPMTVLIAMQFYSPQSAWVNHGLGDKEEAGFAGALGYSRPPGTFSFNNGTTLFYSFVAPFILFFWIDGKKNINKIILIAATVCLFEAIPLSISRALFFQVLVCLVFMMLAIVRNPKYLGRMLLALLGGIVVIAILSQVSYFQTAISAFTERFTTANENEGGVQSVILDRYLGGMVYALSTSANSPIFGYGMGMGTNVGSMLLSGQVVFLISEGEWGRMIGELGPILGLGVVFIRIRLALKATVESYRKLVIGDLLPWMLLSYGFLTIAQGGWSQPTSLGFFVMSAGLTFASLKDAPVRIPMRRPVPPRPLTISGANS